MANNIEDKSEQTKLLNCQQLSCRTRSGKWLVKEISEDVVAGQVTVIAGGNGAGKSSLLKLFAKQPITGKISGELNYQQDGVQKIKLQDYAQRISYLPQQSELYFPLTVKHVIALGALPHTLNHLKQTQLIEQALEVFLLQPLAQRDFRTLSGGERQRCQLARSWLQLQPMQQGVWLLDEPMNNLDLQHQQLLLKIIRQQAEQGHAVVMVLHDLNAALQAADIVWLMHQGQVVLAGSSREVLTAETISQYFSVAAMQIEINGRDWLLLGDDR